MNSQFHAGILNPSDEFQYWDDLSESAEKNPERERATYFTEQFKLIQKVCRPTFIPQVLNYVYYTLLYVFKVVFKLITKGKNNNNYCRMTKQQDR